jgi:hypothetical protein
MERVEHPLVPSPFCESLTVSTYHLEELTSTKLRALHDRRTGRDIYHLFRIADLDLNQAAVRKMVLYDFYRAYKALHYPTYLSNVERKIAECGFRDDVRGLMRHGTELDWETACRQALARFEFLGDLDDRAPLFLDLVKSPLGKPYPKAREETLHEIEHPLAWLMEALPISAEARTMTQEDSQLHQPDTKA